MAAAASGLLSWLTGSAPSREFTAEELYASKDEGKMYIALNGRVYDVDPRPDMYGPGAPYNKLLGRDATRALATMELKQVDLAPMLEADMDTEELKTLREWEAKYSQKYDVVGTLQPGSVLQLRPAAEPSSEPELEPEPEPEPEPQPEPEQERELQPRWSSVPLGAPDPTTAAAETANRARIERLENQTVLNYYARKAEVQVVDMYCRGDAPAHSSRSRTRPTRQEIVATAPKSIIDKSLTVPVPIEIRGGDVLRIVDFTDASKYEGRVGVATGRRNESTGRYGIAIPMANGAEGTLMVPPDCFQKHSGPTESSAVEDAVEFLDAGTAALKTAEAAQNRTQRRAWLRRAVMWYKGLGFIMPGHPSQIEGFKRCEALTSLMNPQQQQNMRGQN